MTTPAKTHTEACYGERLILDRDNQPTRNGDGTLKSTPCGGMVVFTNHVGTCPRCGCVQRIILTKPRALRLAPAPVSTKPPRAA